VVESAAYTGDDGSGEASGETSKAWIASAAKRREAATRAAGGSPPRPAQADDLVFGLLATLLWVLVAGIWMVKQGPPVTESVTLLAKGHVAV
jgi:hypothetical protein